MYCVGAMLPKMQGNLLNLQRRFTVNGTLIPQDPEGKDMCILFLKYGRCRFKGKCKNSHWVPPLPDELYPVKIKPPLPKEPFVENKGGRSENSCMDDWCFKPECETIVKTSSNKSHNSECTCGKEVLCSDTIINNSEQEIATNIRDKSIFDSKYNMKEKPNTELESELCGLKERKLQMVPRRFEHVFQDSYYEDKIRCSGVERIFLEAGAYYDNLTRKVEVPIKPQNKVEKHRLKVLRRIHWQTVEALKRKLADHPPSYSLKFDRNKINFDRLRPYVYVLVHECLCAGGVTKPVRPSALDYLVADTLVVYVDTKCTTAQETEEKLQQWGARAVRARQCVDHLWHILAVSAKSPEGCAPDVVNIEQDVMKGSRVALDYAHACAFALRRAKFHAKKKEKCERRKVSSSVRQGLETTKRNVIDKKKGTVKARASFPDKCVIKDEEDLTQKTDNEKEKTDNEKEKTVDVSVNKTGKKRRRSRQFKKVSLYEKKKLKTRCASLLSAPTNCKT